MLVAERLTKQYGALTAGDDPVGRVPPEDTELQFLVASAVYRENAGRAKDKTAMIGAADQLMYSAKRSQQNDPRFAVVGASSPQPASTRETRLP